MHARRQSDEGEKKPARRPALLLREANYFFASLLASGAGAVVVVVVVVVVPGAGAAAGVSAGFAASAAGAGTGAGAAAAGAGAGGGAGVGAGSCLPHAVSANATRAAASSDLFIDFSLI
jgi:hypothetical protein